MTFFYNYLYYENIDSIWAAIKLLFEINMFFMTKLAIYTSLMIFFNNLIFTKRFIYLFLNFLFNWNIFKCVVVCF